MVYPDPDQDKTNPEFSYRNAKQEMTTDPRWLEMTDEELEESAELHREELEDDELAQTLRDPLAATNNPDPILEEDREEAFVNEPHEHDPRYPDDFVRTHSRQPASADELFQQQTAVEDFYSSTIEFDQIGDEGENDEEL